MDLKFIILLTHTVQHESLRNKFTKLTYHKFVDKQNRLIFLMNHLPGGNLLLSMSMATTLMIKIQIGQSRTSFSPLTNVKTDMH